MLNPLEPSPAALFSNVSPPSFLNPTPSGFSVISPLAFPEVSPRRFLNIFPQDFIAYLPGGTRSQVFATQPTLKPQPHVPAKGAFGDELPQNVPAEAGSSSIRTKGVRPPGNYDHSDRVGPDGLPQVGAVIYPGQEYYSQKDMSTGAFNPKYCTCLTRTTVCYLPRARVLLLEGGEHICFLNPGPYTSLPRARVLLLE